jgi:hypothetical protein
MTIRKKVIALSSASARHPLQIEATPRFTQPSSSWPAAIPPQSGCDATVRKCRHVDLRAGEQQPPLAALFPKPHLVPLHARLGAELVNAPLMADKAETATAFMTALHATFLARCRPRALHRPY